MSETVNSLLAFNRRVWQDFSKNSMAPQPKLSCFKSHSGMTHKHIISTVCVLMKRWGKCDGSGWRIKGLADQVLYTVLCVVDFRRSSCDALCVWSVWVCVSSDVSLQLYLLGEKWGVCVCVCVCCIVIWSLSHRWLLGSDWGGLLLLPGDRWCKVKGHTTVHSQVGTSQSRLDNSYA